MQIALIAIVLLLLYQGALYGYWRENYYQEHFVYLWTFLVLALVRSVRPPFRRAFTWKSARDWLGISLTLAAAVLLTISQLVGSVTGTRSSLVLFLTGIAMLAIPNWHIWRCLLHGILLQFCFGIPHAVFFGLTKHMQNGVASVAAWPAQLGLMNYEAHGTSLQFPHYLLHITPDCSGMTQVFTFGGIAALGILSSESSRMRILLVFLLALSLAWIANLARVLGFVILVGLGWTKGVDDPWWHAGIGLCIYMPFVTVLVYAILKTHREIPRRYTGSAPEGQIAIAWLLLPLALAATPQLLKDDRPLDEPGYFVAIQAPPGHQVTARSSSEASDRLTYGTDWLLNARFEDDAAQSFDLLHYATNSTSHLCVHHVSSCMYWPDQIEVTAPPIIMDEIPWWRINLERPDAADTVHVYYSFQVGDQLFDDSIWTQLKVFSQRLSGSNAPIRFTRVTFRGPLPDQPTDYERGILDWLGQTALSER